MTIWLDVKFSFLVLGVLHCGSIFTEQAALAQVSEIDAAESTQTTETGGLRPVSRSLPINVVRLRAPFVYSKGESGFTASGTRERTGFELRRFGQLISLEGSFFSGGTIYLQAPFVLLDQVGLNTEQFRKSSFYSAAFDQLSARVSASLIEQGICQTETNCRQLIRDGFALPQNKTIELEDGEQAEFLAGVPLRSYMDSIIVNAVRPESGKTGLGDLEMGLNYTLLELDPSASSEMPLGLSAGAYVRFPTGEFENVPRSQRALGRGSTDVGARLGFDFLLETHTLFSVLYTAEKQVIAGKKRASQRADSRMLSAAESLNATQDSLRQSGYLRVEYNFAGLFSDLQPLSTELRLKFESEPQTSLGPKVLSKSRSGQALLGGLRFENLNKGTDFDQLPLSFIPFISTVPFVLGMLYEYPLASSGENVFVAAENLMVYLELYYRF